MTKSKTKVLVLGTAAVSAVSALIGLDAHARHTRRADVERLCNAETLAKTSLERDRAAVEGAARSGLRSEGVAILGRLEKATPAGAADELATVAREAGVAPCAAVQGYGALARRVGVRHALDRMCRAISPRTLARTKAKKRVDVLVDWARTNAQDADVASLLEPALGQDPAAAATTLKPLLASYDVHVCPLLPGLLAKTDPSDGPNVVLAASRLEDGREPQLESAVRAHLARLRECYTAALAKSPALEGTFEVALQVTAKGAVERLRALDDASSIAGDAAQCLLSELKTISVPASDGAAHGTLSFELFVVR